LPPPPTWKNLGKFEIIWALILTT